MTNERQPRRPQIPATWVIDYAGNTYEAWSAPDGCRAIVLQLPNNTAAVTVKVFRGETAWQDAARLAGGYAVELVTNRDRVPMVAMRARLPLIADRYASDELDR